MMAMNLQGRREGGRAQQVDGEGDEDRQVSGDTADICRQRETWRVTGERSPHTSA